MNPTQNIVGIGGLALILVNFWMSPQRKTVSGLLSGNATGTAHGVFVELGGELLFVVVATILAGISTTWAHAMVAVIIGLWILWLLAGRGSAWVSKKTGTKTTAYTGGVLA